MRQSQTYHLFFISSDIALSPTLAILSSGFIPSDFPTEFLCEFLACYIRATSPASLTILNLIILMIYEQRIS
jgi:hypothetical protein